jgi:hypothetical protein
MTISIASTAPALNSISKSSWVSLLPALQLPLCANDFVPGPAPEKRLTGVAEPVRNLREQ